MGIAAGNTCPVCGATYPLGTSICITPGCNGTPVNFGHRLDQLLDNRPHSISDVIFGAGDVSLADGLHFLVAPLRVAALSSPYVKVRLTVWGEDPSSHGMDNFPEAYGIKRRILTLENRAGWGLGLCGPMKGVTNFAPLDMTCLTNISGPGGKKTKTIHTKMYSWPLHETHETLDTEVFGVDFMTGWAKGFATKERHGEIRRYTTVVRVEEKNITRADFDTLYDRFGDLPERIEKPKCLPYMYYGLTRYETAEEYEAIHGRRDTIEG